MQANQEISVALVAGNIKTIPNQYTSNGKMNCKWTSRLSLCALYVELETLYFHFQASSLTFRNMYICQILYYYHQWFDVNLNEEKMSEFCNSKLSWINNHNNNCTNFQLACGMNACYYSPSLTGNGEVNSILIQLSCHWHNIGHLYNLCTFNALCRIERWRKRDFNTVKILFLLKHNIQTRSNFL